MMLGNVYLASEEMADILWETLYAWLEKQRKKSSEDPFSLFWFWADICSEKVVNLLNLNADLQH